MAVEKPEIWAEILGMEFFGPETLRITGRNAPKNPRPKFRVKFRVIRFQISRHVGHRKSAWFGGENPRKIRVGQESAGPKEGGGPLPGAAPRKDIPLSLMRKWPLGH